MSVKTVISPDFAPLKMAHIKTIVNPERCSIENG